VQSQQHFFDGAVAVGSNHMAGVAHFAYVGCWSNPAWKKMISKLLIRLNSRNVEAVGSFAVSLCIQLTLWAQESFQWEIVLVFGAAMAADNFPQFPDATCSYSYNYRCAFWCCLCHICWKGISFYTPT
jgi:hypothetical protein